MELIVFLLCFPIFCFVSWCGICYLMLCLSGYSELGEHYKIGLLLKKETIKSNAILGLIRFQGTLSVGLHPEGVYLEISPVFRLNAPKLLLLPWADAFVEEVYTETEQVVLRLGPQKIKLCLFGNKHIQAIEDLISPLMVERSLSELSPEFQETKPFSRKK